MNFLDFLVGLFRKKIIIEADDSGFGSLYGGALIFMTSGRKDFEGEVPLEAFNIKDKLERKKKVDCEVVGIFKEGIAFFQVDPKNAVFHLCRGNVFDKAARYLEKKGYKVVRKEITGRTNALAEDIFRQILRKKYHVKSYNDNDYRKDSLRQYSLLRKRRDFKNVKQSSKGVSEIKLGISH